MVVFIAFAIYMVLAGIGGGLGMLIGHFLVKATGRPWTVWPAAVVVAVGLTILGVGVGFNMNFVAAAAFIGLISARKNLTVVNGGKR
jgi:hypothetical protein